MLLTDVIQQPRRALQHLERYVNEGSPSGFTEMNISSDVTSPFGSTPAFGLYAVTLPRDKILNYRDVPRALPSVREFNANTLLIHPDMISHPDLAAYDVVLLESLKVAPTSSARTVQIISGRLPDYIKLHYDRILGRVNRRLPYKKAIAGPEVSSIVEQALLDGTLPKEMAILPETGARAAKLAPISDDSQTWGMVWRSHSLVGQRASTVKCLLPLFSLWSGDRHQPGDPSLIYQLIRHWKLQAEAIIIHHLLVPIVDAYFALVARLGLQLETNAQNVLVGLDESLAASVVVLRDLMGAEKDLTIRQALGLDTEFVSSPYKCISRDMQGKNYYIRHSIAFDFKLSLYVLEPIISVCARILDIPSERLVAVVRSRTAHWLKELPTNYFPADGMWYSYPRRLLVDPSDNLANPNPKFR
jgi:siderophore synthetase component